MTDKISPELLFFCRPKEKANVPARLLITNHLHIRVNTIQLTVHTNQIITQLLILYNHNNRSNNESLQIKNHKMRNQDPAKNCTQINFDST